MKTVKVSVNYVTIAPTKNAQTAESTGIVGVAYNMRDYYEVKCPDCGKITRFTDEREDGIIECLHCDNEIEIKVHLTTKVSE